MRLSDYSTIIKEDIYLIHNTLYNSVIKIYGDEEKAFLDSISKRNSFEYNPNVELQKALKDMRMIIEDDIIESRIVNYNYINAKKNYFHVIMMITRQCNFRCTYCYEDHTSQTMSQDVYKRTISFIKQMVLEKGYNEVIISFFGGEPTLESRSVLKFLDELKNELPEDIIIKSNMTTNGYLLNFEMFKSFIERGITNYQITVDGTRENHNKTRFLEGGLGTWDKIINNLKVMKNSEHSFMVTIRTNFTPKSLETAEEFYKYISKEFGNDSRFYIHYENVRNLGGDRVNQLELIDTQNDVDKYLFGILNKYKLKNNSNVEIFTTLFSMCCYAASFNSFFVDYDGTLRKCSVIIDEPSNEVGRLEDNDFELDEVKISNWTSYNLERECFNCNIFPICYGKMCPNTYLNPTHCEEVRQSYILNIKQKYL
ncbi:radical SAM protein [Tissierella carlieri]|jgi:uncharacterized protein|uniref:radical SAM/SPASM domain-containing protein n=1 Tax=Tissierella carlieri TaxID=689904 RepID=UPI001C0FC63E|nr:radical SAM protein [Tissierella carlieri]MBU5313074.1 radical SAM protein [Tissierella carlieri]